MTGVDGGVDWDGGGEAGGVEKGGLLRLVVGDCFFLTVFEFPIFT